jgi:hypothetical protein
MKSVKLIIGILFLLPQFIFAQCPEDIQSIKKGQVANCEGLLFSPEASKNVANTQDDAKHYKELSDLLYKRQELTTKDITILDKRLHLYMEQSNTLATQLYKKEQDGKWQKFIYFGLGVLATGFAFYGVSHLK